MEYKDIVTSIPIDVIYFKLKFKERFDFSRFGDGEIHYMRGTKFIKNRKPAVITEDILRLQHHKWMPDLARKLNGILEASPKYYIALQRLGYRQHSEFVDKITSEYNLSWYNADVIHRESIRHGLNKLFNTLSKRRCLVIGPSYMKKMNKFDFELIEIPIRNCFLKYEKVKNEIELKVQRFHYNFEDPVILYCAGIMSNVLINYFAGRCTQIDIGSAFDPHCGVKSRAYHKNLKV